MTETHITDTIRDRGVAAVAEAAGLSRPHLANVIVGRERLSAAACVALADAIGANPAEVAEALGGTVPALMARLALAEGRDVRAALLP